MTRRQVRSRVAASALCAIVVLALESGAGAATTTTSTTTTATTAPATQDWTVYHGDPAGTGVAGAVAAVDVASPHWTSPVLQGALYGEPLASEQRVFVATEDDTIYALSTSSGAVEWSTHVGTPVPSSALPCGDIAPTVGITGTPVIDTSRNEIFAVADELVRGTPAHVLVGLSTTTGKIELSQNVDPAGAQPSALLQRTGLSLDQGRVVFGMGGNYGDCAIYRGRVISVPESGGTADVFTVDAASGNSQGAVWMGGAAPVVDADGDIWVSAGNGSVSSSRQAYDDSDSLLELSPSMSLLQYFAPSDWPENNAQDLDMSTAPALLSDGQVVVAGKSRIVYLLNASALGGIGKQEASLSDACSDDIDGGVAVEGTTVFLPCVSGTIAVSATANPDALHLLWHSSLGGGPAIVAAGLVWTMGQDGILFALNPSTGALVKQAQVGTPANHFSTPSIGEGLLLASSADRVVAFSAPATTSTPIPTSSSTTAVGATTTSVAQSGSGSSAATALVVAAALVVVAAVAWLLWRRRRATGGS